MIYVTQVAEKKLNENCLESRTNFMPLQKIILYYYNYILVDIRIHKKNLNYKTVMPY